MPRQEQVRQQSRAVVSAHSTRSPEDLVVLITTKMEPAALTKLAKTITDDEYKALIDWAFNRNEEKKAAEKDYKAARILIEAKARLQKVLAAEGTSAGASFSSRTTKEIDVYGVYTHLRKSLLWKNGDNTFRRELFNKCFSLNREAAAAVIGADVIAEHTEEKEDKYAVLSLKRS